MSPIFKILRSHTMKLFPRSLPLVAGAALVSHAIAAPSVWGDWPLWGDQKNGSYQNPVLPGD